MFMDFIKKEKWKISLIHHLLLICVATQLHPVSSQAWDGVYITQSDFQGLQAFKRELIDPKGFLKSWNDSGYGACSGGWAGIKCAQGEVIVIQLPWKGLGGRISEKIGQLQALRKLSLHDNAIGGSIPQALGYLSKLRGVQLFNNRLSGSIPPSVAYSPALQTLDLSNNAITGIIPDTLANSTKLYWLNLSYNSLSGSIPISLTRSISITFLDLGHNNLSGPIPNTWGETPKNRSSFFRLQLLSLDNNFLSGNIPASLGNLRELHMLSISRNQLTGAMPSELGSLARLKTLDLSYNTINGSLPVSISNLSLLALLNLESNSLDNHIPESFDRLRNLSVLNLKRNHLHGPIPSSIKAPSSPVPGQPSEQRHKGRKLSTKDIILIVAGVMLAVLTTLCCILLCCLIRKKAAAKSKDGQTTATQAVGSPGGGKGPPPTAADVEAAGENGGKLVHFDGPMAFTADDLLCATAEIMGKSTYGTVYKATLEDGSQVAVKRLREKITKSQKEFESEVNVLGKIRHPNLLAMRAYYMGPKGEKLLVFDYMPKGSLATFLHARGPDTQVNWPTRMMIAQGMTRGLLYLHSNENIIHGNLTSSNVLLDEQTNAKIADYGLSKLMTAAANSNVIATAGALGYRAPELSKLKKANTKTDVYSLGVIILELLTGKSPGEAMNGVDLPQWVASIVKEEWTNEVFDIELMKDATIIGDELLNTLKLALHCVDPSPSARPEVQQVLQQLEEIRPQASLSGAGVGPSSEYALSSSSS
ncbi:hypothetical protein ACFE04_016486 [Oxalis oulophora]